MGVCGYLEFDLWQEVPRSSTKGVLRSISTDRQSAVAIDWLLSAVKGKSDKKRRDL